MARKISEIESNEIFALRAACHFLVDPTYTLIEIRCSILSLFCATHNLRSESEEKWGLLDEVTSRTVLWIRRFQSLCSIIHGYAVFRLYEPMENA